VIIYRMAAFLWWSKLRWLFEPIVRRVVQNSGRIVTGPLRGLDFSGGLAQMLGIYEYPTQKTIRKNLGTGGVFYDIGANNGFFTLLASQLVGSTGHVSSFEPFPKNIASIKNVISKNKLTNCHLEECAVADLDGEAQLFFKDNIATPSIMYKAGDDLASLRVATVTLNDYILSNPKPTLIKLDVEGAEVAVLKGSKSLIASDAPPSWIVEIHHPHDEEIVVSLLAPGGYRIEKLPERGNRRSHFPIRVVAIQR